MNYYHPYQRSTGEWFYVMVNDGMVYRVGYCAEDACQGHTTEEEAREHYRQYELDNATYRDATTLPEEAQRKQRERHCAVCQAWTRSFAQLGPGRLQIVFLCADHLNRDGLDQAVPTMGDAISSY